MSDRKKVKDLLTRYSAARIPFVRIDTIERGRTLDVLAEIAEEMPLAFYVHTLSKGLYNLMDGKVLNSDRTVYGAVDYMTDQMKKRENLTLILTDVPDLSTDNDLARQIFDLTELAYEKGGVVMVLTNKPVWNLLQRQGMVVKFDLPKEEEMYEIVYECVDGYEGQVPIEWDESDVREAASILTGVTKFEAQNVIAALVANGELKKADMDEVRFAKTRMFSDISGLEKIEVDDSVAEVGGLLGLRKWLDEKKILLTPEVRDKLKAKGIQPPRGVLLVGVPGCGKSLSAKSIAYQWKLPLYRLDFATVQGKYVGQSENQLKDALTMAESVSPCVLWIDEIEKGLSGANAGAGDGGVATRMVGQFLFWLQECKKPVFVVATANDVSMLPSELLRRGRFDELFFIDLPDADERKEIITLYMKKYLECNFDQTLIDDLVNLTDGFTGADIESTVRDLSYRLHANEALILDKSMILEAFDNVVPLSQTSPERIEAIRDWGKERAVPASGRPIGEQNLGARRKITGRKVLV